RGRRGPGRCSAATPRGGGPDGGRGAGGPRRDAAHPRGPPGVIDAADVAAAGAALARGGLALLPTDTVYGLAASLDTPDGVSALYAAKGRPRSRPFQVLLYAPEGLEEALAPLPASMAAAAPALLPGPATCLRADPAGRYAAAAGEAPGSAGIRAPRVQGVLAPLAALDIPLVATSANEPGGRDPAALADLDAPIRRA